MSRFTDPGTGDPGLDQLRNQLDKTEQETRGALKLVHIPSVTIALVRSSLAANFPISVKKPEDLSQVLSVLPGFIEDANGDALNGSWLPECGILSDGSILIKYIPGLTNGHTYRFSLIAVGV